MSGELALRDFRAALFDVDGTLIDSLQALRRGLADVFARYLATQPPADEVQAMIGLPLRTQLTRFLGRDPTEHEMAEMTEFAVERFHHYSELESPWEPALESLRLCKQSGLKTALVTSKNSDELKLFMSRFTHADHVDAYVCASDVSHPKPNPDCVLLACELLGVDPGDALMVGDSIYDIRAARDAGATPVAVAYGSHSAERLRSEAPAMLLNTAEELLEWTRRTLLETTCPERNL